LRVPREETPRTTVERAEASLPPAVLQISVELGLLALLMTAFFLRALPATLEASLPPAIMQISVELGLLALLMTAFFLRALPATLEAS
jgi:hypothetical protein